MAPLKSWLAVDDKSHFSVHNIPFGIISTDSDSTPRPAVAIGDFALDLRGFTEGNGFSALSAVQPHLAVFSESTLNAFAALGRPIHKVVREYLQSVLLQNGSFATVLERNEQLRQSAIIPLEECEMHLPLRVGDYTDFYAGLHHAYNVGVLFRGPQNALQKNYKHLPVGYHGRASSVVVSGTAIQRPLGQILVDPETGPQLSPCRKLDYELELGCFVCASSDLGEPISIEDAPDYLFGVVLMNDWSARDIQAWEYVPLGPFNSKNFGTSVSPWVVLMDALQPFATFGIQNDVQPLPYLDEKGRKSNLKIDLTVTLTTASGSTSTLTKTSAENLLFSFPQMLAHHTVGGCPFNVGDLLGSGTISGKGKGEKGCLLEQTENGAIEIELDGGERRKFLEDGDMLSLSGACGKIGELVGFGECVGKIVPGVQIARK